MRPPPKPADDDPLEHGDSYGSEASPPSGVRRLVGRIAEALQVPPATLYEVPNLKTLPLAPITGIITTDADLDAECAALSRAYRLIRDSAERRRLLALVHEMARSAAAR